MAAENDRYYLPDFTRGNTQIKTLITGDVYNVPIKNIHFF